MTSDSQRIGNLMSVRRLPVYLHLLKRLDISGREFVSTTHIAEELQLQPDQIRKDLTLTGIVGKPKLGYYVPALIKAIESFLRWDNATDAFLVGTGNLGSALLGYEGFQQHGLNIVAAFDLDKSKVGRVIHGHQVLALSKLPDLADRMQVHMGIITVPSECAQDVADVMVSGGISAIWNFAPIHLEVPKDVIAQNEDLSSGLAVLSFKLSRRLDVSADVEA